MKVEKVSQCFVKPSSPTPSHLKVYNISLLDQIVPPTYYPVILFYANKETQIVSRSLLLKDALSETLSRFYPFAGKIKNNLSIDCNDEGVCYVEAKASISLFEYLKKPDISSMEKLLPGEVNFGSITVPGSYVMSIQETRFACGGFTIGVLVSHIVCDGTALSSFIKGWAAILSKSNDVKVLDPYLGGPSAFLQHNAVSLEETSIMALLCPFLKKMKTKSRRFVFNASAIASLKDKAISSGVKNPTRVEVVTALLSKCLMAVFKTKSGLDKPLAIHHAVNLRKKAVPPYPECSLGNFVLLTAAQFTPKETELSSLVCKLKEAIGKFNADLVKKLQGDGGHLQLKETFKETSGILCGNPDEVNHVAFSSWCNFGFYEIDFGWGKPVWITCPGSSNSSETVFVNSIHLMDERKDRGIQAWVYLDEEDINLLENDEELLQYACVDPIPYVIHDSQINN